eukprot:1591535-Pleurochrysis_carterae.AAC.1
MLTALDPEAPMRSPGAADLVWRIVGDAAGSDDGAPCPGLGGWFYGLWWRVPSADVPGLVGLHIT